MNAYFIGEILKEYRTRFEISQEDLSFGFCAVSTLSRIENGTQIPGRKLAEALFSKMGMKTPSSATPMSRLDFKRENLEHKIIDSIANGNFDVFATLEEYKTCGKTLDPLEKQFYIFYNAIAEDALNHNAQKALKEYLEAINLSIKNFSLDGEARFSFRKFCRKYKHVIASAAIGAVTGIIKTVAKNPTPIGIVEGAVTGAIAAGIGAYTSGKIYVEGK